eukprot:5755467-Amphidinium_carterae.1
MHPCTSAGLWLWMARMWRTCHCLSFMNWLQQVPVMPEQLRIAPVWWFICLSGWGALGREAFALRFLALALCPLGLSSITSHNNCAEVSL